MEISFEDVMVKIVGRNMAGDEKCQLQCDDCKTVGWLRAEIQLHLGAIQKKVQVQFKSCRLYHISLSTYLLYISTCNMLYINIPPWWKPRVCLHPTQVRAWSQHMLDVLRS